MSKAFLTGKRFSTTTFTASVSLLKVYSSTIAQRCPSYGAEATREIRAVTSVHLRDTVLVKLAVACKMYFKIDLRHQ